MKRKRHTPEQVIRKQRSQITLAQISLLEKMSQQTTFERLVAMGWDRKAHDGALLSVRCDDCR